MKTWNAYSKGLIAILLLASVSCMNKGFQTVAFQDNSKTSSDPVIPDQNSGPLWDEEEAKNQTAENTPVEGTSSESTSQEPQVNSQPDVKSESKDDAGKDSAEDSKAASPGKAATEEKESGKKEEKKTIKPPKTARLPKSSEKNKEESKDKEALDQEADEKKTAQPAQADKADFTGPGKLKPTIYYFPVFNEDESRCDKNTMMHASGGKDLLMVCEKTAKECGLQGSCAIIQGGVTRSFNVLGAKDGQDRFFEIKDECKFGFGVDNACLDPFYTLAADLSLYEPGQVIFVPAVVGMALPDGSKHSGYFVIRDRGRGVTGTGRFDFFSGMVAWRDSKNPFTKMGLGDVNTNIPYFKVKGKTAQQVLRHRAFPKLPRK